HHRIIAAFTLKHLTTAITNKSSICATALQLDLSRCTLTRLFFTRKFRPVKNLFNETEFFPIWSLKTTLTTKSQFIYLSTTLITNHCPSPPPLRLYHCSVSYSKTFKASSYVSSSI